MHGPLKEKLQFWWNYFSQFIRAKAVSFDICCLCI